MTNHPFHYIITQLTKRPTQAPDSATAPRTKQPSSLTQLSHALFAILLAIASLALNPTTASAQDIIRLTGKVFLKTDKEPLVGVNFTSNKLHSRLRKAKQIL